MRLQPVFSCFGNVIFSSNFLKIVDKHKIFFLLCLDMYNKFLWMNYYGFRKEIMLMNNEFLEY